MSFKLIINHEVRQARIECSKCRKCWAGVVDCCGKDMPFNLVLKRNKINRIFIRYQLFVNSVSTAFDGLHWLDARKRLIEISSLEDDWDGEGAPKVDDGVLWTAFTFLEMLKINDYVCPGRIIPSLDGSVLFEWQSADMYVEAEIEQPGLVQWMSKVGINPATYSKTLIPLPE